MILVDTSIWVDHLRRNDRALVQKLETGQVCIHPFVIGELACGHLQARSQVLGLLQGMPHLPTATEEEVLFFIEQNQLMGRGIGYIDMHLLAAVAIDGQARLWTRDKRLHEIAGETGLAYLEPRH